MDVLGHLRLGRRRLIESLSVSAAHDFSRAGTGNYSVDPSNLFAYIDSDGTPKDMYATVEGIAKVKLSGDLAISRDVHDKREIIYSGCSDKEKETIHEAAVIADYHINKALYYLDHKSTKTLYEAWFGASSRKHKDRVRKTYEEMRTKANLLQLTYQCGICTDRTAPAAHCTRIFPRACYSVTDTSLDQTLTSLGQYSLAPASGGKTLSAPQCFSLNLTCKLVSRSSPSPIIAWQIALTWPFVAPRRPS